MEHTVSWTSWLKRQWMGETWFLPPCQGQQDDLLGRLPAVEVLRKNLADVASTSCLDSGSALRKTLFHWTNVGTSFLQLVAMRLQCSETGVLASIDCTVRRKRPSFERIHVHALLPKTPPLFRHAVKCLLSEKARNLLTTAENFFTHPPRFEGNSSASHCPFLSSATMLSPTHCILFGNLLRKKGGSSRCTEFSKYCRAHQSFFQTSFYVCT